MQQVDVHSIGGTFMCKRIRKRKEVIRDAIQDLKKLNPKITFEEDGGCISTSCKTSDELLQLKMPEWIVKVKDSEKSACYGFIHVKIGKKNNLHKRL